MEHRCGTRYKVEIPVYARAHSGAVSSLGCLLNISETGGFLLTTLPVETHSHISLRLIDAEGESSQRLEGEVVRRSFAGLGIVWCEPATDLIRAYSTTPATSRLTAHF
jgi:PilZ domain-containing protein